MMTRKTGKKATFRVSKENPDDRIIKANGKVVGLIKFVWQHNAYMIRFVTHCDFTSPSCLFDDLKSAKKFAAERVWLAL